MLFNSNDNYGSIAKLFHWLMALAIIGMLALGLYMAGLAMTPDKIKLYGIHKSIGALILILVCLRLVWRLVNIEPKLPEHMPMIEKLGAHASHYALYLAMFLMPITGWFMSSASGFPVSVFGLFHLPDFVKPDKDLRMLFGTVHYYVAYGLIGLITLHALAALKHHFIDKDNVLTRMLP